MLDRSDTDKTTFLERLLANIRSCFQHFGISLDALLAGVITQEDEATARIALLAMIDLYHGDYVQPFYSDRCSFRRDNLRNAYLVARCHHAHLAWRSEQFEDRQPLAIDACHMITQFTVR